ncbi:MAG: DegT/DnrJ/EryC1/StrS family aminotransferase [Nitrospirae bacterium]|nr:DegT/DnrJ/EryC1/StrS family aminotransferase [Magnetococcales bacterium]
MTSSLPLIPMNDLGRKPAFLLERLDQVARKVVNGSWYILGPHVQAFETAFSAYCGVPHCVGVGNGTDALEIALRALDVGPGCDVLTVANAGMYSTSAILSCGARPVFVDVDPETYCMDPDALATSLTQKTRAVIVTHLYGLLADMDRILTVTNQAHVPVVEDCAQAHGAIRHGKRAGSFGTLGCFSFYPTKNLGALGDGGAITTQDESIDRKLRQLRQYGWQTRYDSVLPYGRNSRLDEIQAAFLLEMLPYLDQANERRRRIAGKYKHSGVNMSAGDGPGHVRHLCVMRHKNRDAFRALLRSAGVATDVHFPTPDYRQPAVMAILGKHPQLPVTENAISQIISLPCFPEMTDAEVGMVSTALVTVSESLVES